MGLRSWEKSPNGRIVKTDTSIAKNYLTGQELESLGRLVNAYLDLAEDRANRKIPMTMQDWSNRLDEFLKFADRDVLQNSGHVSAEAAQHHAECEFELYRITQDRLLESDFDRALQESKHINTRKTKHAR